MATHFLDLHFLKATAERRGGGESGERCSSCLLLNTKLALPAGKAAKTKPVIMVVAMRHV